MDKNMNKNFLKLSISMALSLWGSQLIAGNVDIPNTFVSDTAASASEVNANFSAIETEIDDNDGRITINTDDISTNEGNISANTASIAALASASAIIINDANGAYVGRVIGIGNLTSVSILTDQGYRTIIDVLKGSVASGQTVYFETTDCTGTVYTEAESAVGTVFLPYTLWDSATASAAGLLSYIPYDTTDQPVNVSSEISFSGSCNAIATVQKQVYAAIQNDPGVTGIQNYVYPTHMRLE